MIFFNRNFISYKCFKIQKSSFSWAGSVITFLNVRILYHNPTLLLQMHLSDFYFKSGLNLLGQEWGDGVLTQNIDTTAFCNMLRNLQTILVFRGIMELNVSGCPKIFIFLISQLIYFSWVGRVWAPWAHTRARVWIQVCTKPDRSNGIWHFSEMEGVQVEYLCGSGVTSNRFSSLPKSKPFNKHEMGIMFVSGEVL